MGPGGALQAVQEAQAQGLTRFIGITGHGTLIARLHLRALERADFDSVLLPYNYPMMQNPQYATDFEALMAVCEARNVAVQTMNHWRADSGRIGRKPAPRGTNPWRRRMTSIALYTGCSHVRASS